jgi:hypothetical protein
MKEGSSEIARLRLELPLDLQGCASIETVGAALQLDDLIVMPCYVVADTLDVLACMIAHTTYY